ncbi:GNAT family N-acetyltransferase [Govanella unica]|uniref:GNAT family N-acetyltransferase n=1 Tax=Govanella unica TaxID=2975056 RepID=A0A9X3TZR7_9PROT|nr:GNAT family N-acetyltransferase [Govania unica]MDA5194682.1 GNAT family N-acetyltransferase [Govania unica]
MTARAPLVITAVGREAAALLAELRSAAGVEPGWPAEEVAALLVLPSVGALLARRGAEPLGYVLYALAAGEAEIYDIAVSLACRRMGVGGELLDAAIEALGAAQAEQLHLEVAVDNDPAIALYEQRGFVVNGRRRGYYQRAEGQAVDALVMTRSF